MIHRMRHFISTLALALPGFAWAEQDVWTEIAPPAVGTDYYRMVVPGHDYLYVTANDTLEVPFGLYRRPHDAGPTGWERLPLEGRPLAVAVVGTADEHVLASTFEEKFWYSSDGGSTWIDRTAGLPTSAWMERIAGHESGWVYVTIRDAQPGHQYGVAHSTNFGANWAFSRLCGNCTSGPYFDLAVKQDNPEMAWHSYQDGFFETQVERTTDGETWERLNLPVEVGYEILDLAIDVEFADRVHMLLPDPIWWFDGLEFTNYTFPPFEHNMNMSLTVPMWDPGSLYASGRLAGVVDVKRADEEPYGPTTWVSIGEGLPAEIVPEPMWVQRKFNLKPVPSQPKLYLSVWQLGLFERDLTLDTSDSPIAVDWFGNRFGEPVPNPSSGSIAWSLELERGTGVRLSVVDPAGRLLFATPVEWRPAGTHDLGPSLSPFLRDLPQGVYFIRGEGDRGGTTRRVSIAR